jgi:hypothetical protein
MPNGAHLYVLLLVLVLVLVLVGVSSILRTRCNLRETPWIFGAHRNGSVLGADEQWEQPNSGAVIEPAPRRSKSPAFPPDNLS